MRLLTLLRSLVAALALGALLLPPTAAAAPSRQGVFPPEPEKGSKLDSLMQVVAESGAAPAVAAQSFFQSPDELAVLIQARAIRIDDESRVQAYVRLAEDNAEVRAALASHGVVIELESGGIIQARVPLSALGAVAELASVRSVTTPEYGRTSSAMKAGAKLTQGDSLLAFSAIRSTYGVNGSGVTVGVISDGIFGLQTAINSGDLPATSFNRVNGKLISTTGGVIAQSFRADGDLEGGFDEETGAEGTAMLEIVHDIAPGAQLRFANFATSLEFMAAVDFLAANSDILLDDIAWLNPPHDGTRDIPVNASTELNRLTNKIRGYYTSVGNYASSHYQGAYTSAGAASANYTYHGFSSSSGTNDCLGLGSSTNNVVRVPAGGIGVIRLSWDQPGADYDLFIWDNGSGDLVDIGGSDNILLGDSFEVALWVNNTASARYYDVEVLNWQNTPSRTLELYSIGDALSLCGNDFNYNTASSSVVANADAGGGVISVGAINQADSGTDTIEPFSSRGPTNDGRLKPEVTAVDGVAITGAGGFGSSCSGQPCFFGTSAASPHLGGLAALLLSLRPSWKHGESGDDPAADRTALRNAILNNAVDLGEAGPDNTFGYGRVSGIASANAIAPGVFNFNAATYSGTEGAGNVTVTVTRTNGSAGAVSVNFASSNGTALAGGDYTAASGTLNWADGETASKTFQVAVLDDSIYEVAETLSLALSGATGDATLGSTVSATLTIQPDNDVDAQPPVWPSGSALSLLSRTTESITVGWGTGTDLSGISGYKVYRGGVLQGTVGADVHAFKVSGLSADTEYSFKVEAVDTANNAGTDGPSASFKTSKLVPVPGMGVWGMVLGVAAVGIGLAALTVRRRHAEG